MRTLNRQGVALLTALFILVLVSGIATLMFSRTLSEINHSRDNTRVVQTRMLAKTATELGSTYMNFGKFVEHLGKAVTDMTEGGANPWLFGGTERARPSPSTVASSLEDLSQRLQTRVDGELCHEETGVNGAPGRLRLRLFFTDTACGVGGTGERLPDDVKLPAGRLLYGSPNEAQTYVIPFVLQAYGTLEDGEFERSILTQGEVHFNAGRLSFSSFAYLTDQDAESDLWFHEGTIIDGPVHTNSHFRFDRTPWFGDLVTSSGCQNASCSDRRFGAFFDFGDERFVENPNPPQSPVVGDTAPIFSGGVTWNAARIDFPDNTWRQRDAAQGINQDAQDNEERQGLYFDEPLALLELYAADENGRLLLPDGVDNDGAPRWNPPQASYQYIRGCKTASDCATYRTYPDPDNARNIILEERIVDGGGNETWQIRQRSDGSGEPRYFNGVIFVESDSGTAVERLRGPERVVQGSTNGADAPPAVAYFSQITVAADHDIRITRDLRYERPPRSGVTERDQDGNVVRAGVINEDAVNVLGIYTQDGDIVIGNNHASATDLNAPDNLRVHASLMSGNRQIRVEDFNIGPPRGRFELIGGMIQNTRGPFNQFDDSGLLSGYDRTYTYDLRFREGLNPPYFPTTEDITTNSVLILPFSQREQVN